MSVSRAYERVQIWLSNLVIGMATAGAAAAQTPPSHPLPVSSIQGFGGQH